MDTLFGKNQIEQLLDFKYFTRSHTLSKGVIAAYYDLLEYDSIVSNFVLVQRTRDKAFFFPLGIPNTFQSLNFSDKQDVVYSIENKRNITDKRIKEVVYDLDKIFKNQTKQIRRGVELNNRKEFILRDSSFLEIERLYQDWVSYKMNDPKVYRLAFSPKRYLRSFQLKEKGFKIFQKGIYIKDKLYGAICFELQFPYAFELAFISRFWDKELKIINDLNECILINLFWELYQQGIKFINVGPDAGIKGLKTFKNKIPHSYEIIYTN